MSISENTTKINALIEMIHSLPDAGSGSADPLLQSKSVTPSETAQTVTPDSGYDGLSSVSVGAISSAYVGSGVPTKGYQLIVPSTEGQMIASGQYLTGNQIILGDENLIPENIKSGTTIYDVVGTYVGSGGLPDGILAIATDVFTVGTSITSDYTVTHNMGLVPDFSLLVMCDDISSATVSGARLYQSVLHKTFMASGTVYYMRGFEIHFATNGSITAATQTDTGSACATTTTVTFKANTIGKLASGYTYRWVCGVLKDVL